jgi:hypothetical protein
MGSIKVKILGYAVLILFQVISLSIIILILFEFLGISKYLFLNQQRSSQELHSIGYYGDGVSEDPYAPYIVQHLHPYYLFSLPWKEADMIKRNTDIVSLNKFGFRVNPKNLNKKNKTAVLLGGSTAFGHFSSSNHSTVAANLSESLGINVHNRNAPSWNTHQELVALVKYTQPYSLSISLTLSNDITVACVENVIWDTKFNYIDAPESYIAISAKIDDLRGSIKGRSISRVVKDVLKSLFPDTYTLLYKVKNNSENINKFVSKCSVPKNIIVKKFLENQQAMLDISSARGAEHLLVLQPLWSLIQKNTLNYNYKRDIYDRIINSEYCNKNLCLDLSTVFPNLNSTHMFNGKNLDQAIFIDQTHFSDLGTEAYSRIISTFIENKEIF